MTINVDKEDINVFQATLNELSLNAVKDTIFQSAFIKTHKDFYQWKKEYVCKYIPHDILITGWGDFSKGNLQFDICSNFADVQKQQLNHGVNEIKPLMQILFSKWVDNNEKWILNEEFHISDLQLKFSAEEKIMSLLAKTSSILVYGFRDKRSNSDVLYAFFSVRENEKANTSVLSIIMPFLDEALRRVECLPKNTANILQIPTILSVISKRELAVLRLVVQGKTNTEIAENLFISVNTVKNHLKNIFKKIDVSSRAEAVAKYLNSSNLQEEPTTKTKSIFLKTS
jgi:transcriptional regulator EpsA